MEFSYDLTQAEAVYKKFPTDDGISLVNGGALQLTVTAGSNELAIAAATWTNIVGVFYGAAATASGDIANGTSDFSKVLINPFAVYMAEYLNNTSTAITATAYSSKAFTITSDGQAGDWLLGNDAVDADKDQLLYIGSTSTTATMTALSTPTKTPIGTGTYCHIHTILKGRSGTTYGEVDLTSDGTKLLTDATYTGVGILVIDNQITSPKKALQPLRRAQHDNTVVNDVKVFGEILFFENIWSST